MQEVHEEYLDDMKIQFSRANNDCLGYDAFIQIWKKCFPFVKITEFKQVFHELFSEYISDFYFIWNGLLLIKGCWKMQYLLKHWKTDRLI